MADILFATNRAQVANTAQGVPDFGDQVMAAGSLWCGTASIDGITLHDPDAGTIAAIPDLYQGTGFSPKQAATLAASPNPVLVFVHGTNNDFEDAIQRAAYNKHWLEKVAGQVFDVIAFTWPARAYGGVAKILQYQDDYKADQGQADASAGHFGLLLTQLYALKPQLAGRKLGILCHSMGNRMLGGAVAAWFAGGNAPAPPLFDEAILAAADERADTFNFPPPGRLNDLHKLATGITVYFSEADIMMALSKAVNGYPPLGRLGPDTAADRQLFPTDVYAFVDCTDVSDYVGPRLSVDISHQYYRQSLVVRADIAAVLLNRAARRYYYDAARNIWEMVMPPLPYPMVA
jgi:esterase/lipase superfamily enzyme